MKKYINKISNQILQSSRWFVAVLAMLIISACSNRQAIDNTIVKTNVNKSEKIELPIIKPFKIDEYKINPGDELSIEVFGEPELTRPNIQVSDNGNIDYPLIGEVNLSAKTLSDASRIIKDKLAQGFLYQPQVNVRIDNFKPVVVAGIVGKTGLYDYSPGMTYRILLILAEDGQYEWPVEEILVQRNDIRGKPKSIDDALAPGDLVIFKNSGETSGERYYYVDGEVEKPGRYEMESGITLEQAIISAGGLTVFGSRKRIFVRPTSDAKLQKAKLTDFVTPGNVIFVKQSLF